jgi:nucleoside-diphosphate-sugar epimerase
VKVAVTGGAGHIGRAIVDDLVEQGFEVVVGDRQQAPGLPAPLRVVDMEDLGQAVSLFDGCDAVVHAAAIPRPGGCPDSVLFRTNMQGLFSALEACRLLRIPRFVWTSSMSVLGYPFNYRPVEARYLPLDDEHPHGAQDPYALSKSLGEQLVASYAARCGMAAVSLRIVWAHTPATFQRDLVPFWRNPTAGASNMWSYVDTRDCGRAARLALTRELSGHSACLISADDTCMPVPTRRLVADHLPGAPMPADSLPEYGALFDTRAARGLLGFAPQYSWESYGLGTRAELSPRA